MSVLRPKRECCGHIPDIISWWRKNETAGWTKLWEIMCPICSAVISDIAYTEKQAIEMWDNEEVI